MKIRKIRILPALLLALTALSCGATDLETFNKQFRLLPIPQKIELLTGQGCTFGDLRHLFLQNISEKPVMGVMLSSLSGGTSSGKNTLTLALIASTGLPSPEGYILEVSENQAIIKASTMAGLFYGVQTLNQLLEDSRDQQITIPSCRITDYPEIAYRSVHLDLKHHLDAGRYYYDMVDRLAAIKINAIIIEFEDKLRYRKAPVVGAADAISIEEFAALGKYAHERNVQISPLVQGLGHASFILKHEEYKSLRDDPASDWVFDPLSPATYDLQFSLYEDAIAATPCGQYLHVGGDEVGTLGKSDLAKKSGMNPFELQMYWLRKVCDFAAKHNRIPIFWDDMQFKLSGLYPTTYDETIPEKEVNDLWAKNRSTLDKSLPLFPTNCAYMRWNYSTPMIPGNRLAIDWYKEHNLSVMAATGAQVIWAMMPRNKSNFQPIKEFCQLTSEKKMSGILCTVWDDTSPHLETLWRGMYDFGLMSWNYEDIPVAQAHTIFRHRFYSPQLAGASTDFQDMLEDAMPWWETALLASGDRENYHKTFNLVDVPDMKKSGQWSKQNAAKIEGAKKALTQYAVIKEKIKNTEAVAVRNQYAAEVLEQINELQIYSANLIVLLNQLDQAQPKNRKQAALELRTYVEGFGQLRANLEKVYSKTKILGNPPGYQLDSNFHDHLANGTNNTDWMYMYELPMNKKITEWLSRQISVE